MRKLYEIKARGKDGLKKEKAFSRRIKSSQVRTIPRWTGMKFQVFLIVKMYFWSTGNFNQLETVLLE